MTYTSPTSRSDSRQRGKFRASLRAATIAVTGRSGEERPGRTCFDSSSFCIGTERLTTYYLSGASWACRLAALQELLPEQEHARCSCRLCIVSISVQVRSGLDEH